MFEVDSDRNMSDDSSSSDDECEGLLRKALDVNVPQNFNPNSIPQDGHEYLQHVIYERKQCTKLMTSNIDPNSYRKNQTLQIPQNTPEKTCGSHKPSMEWQMKQLEEFKQFRKFIESKITSEATLVTFKEESFIENIKNESPLFSQITKYSQCAKIRMLELITKYLYTVKHDSGINNNIGAWIFAILVLLEIPLSPSNCHVIREFTRKCLDIRSKLGQGSPEECFYVLNFFVCIISRYFSQLDLADQ